MKSFRHAGMDVTVVAAVLPSVVLAQQVTG